ncbi:MAG: hypothetical protein ACD_3C00160G0004 [uncultured bacterium (gcode 4)]|uniref:Uncharacterized protein n=1 Tax=uncultured bacterium (gcode 4) TaxID=1234023 RepID=K2GWM2_9BACT|nr:MAG: hypothetical protein ACD_3C00160G0004 [uncultured bacterium (gcode 4)]
MKKLWTVLLIIWTAIFNILLNSGFLLEISFADGVIPRNNLMVEYLFSSWSTADTSWYSNQTINNGATFGYNWSWAMSYASFSWASQFVWSTWWSSDSTTSFGVSLWVQTTGSWRTNPSNFWTYCVLPWIYQYWGCYTTSGGYAPSWMENYDWNGPQIIFSSKRVGWPSTDMWLWLTSDYKCNFEENTNFFDCSKLIDDKWHNITMVKDDYWVLSIYIDNVLVKYFRWNTSSFWKSISLWKGVVYTNYVWSQLNKNESTKFNWKIWAFRLFRSALSNPDVSWIYWEFPQLIQQTNSSVPVITINQPDTIAPYKTLSAITNTWALSMSMVRGDICDSTLTFDAYSSFTFNNFSDNWIKICYKSTNWIFTTYKLSQAVYWITWESNVISTDSIFSGQAYKSWPMSSKVKTSDFSYPIIWFLAVPNYQPALNFVDLNWDGLTDVMIRNVSVVNSQFVWEWRLMLLNNGDLTFRSGYKCYIEWWGTNLVYGDCADVNYH